MKNQSPLARKYEPPLEERVTVYIQRGAGVIESIGYVGEPAVDMLRALVAEMPGLTHPNSKPVRVIAVDHAKFEEYADSYKLQPVHKEQVFDSATMASKALGFKFNEVAIRLAAARAEAERDAAKKHPGVKVRLRPSAVVRGVTLQYDEDVRDD